MQLTKHHGLGNDFLVLLDLDERHGAVDGETARALCHRHTGIGADGLIRVTPGTGGADLTMHLWNADGSPAEQARETSRAAATRVRTFRDRRHLPGRPAERPPGSASIRAGPATS